MSRRAVASKPAADDHSEAAAQVKPASSAPAPAARATASGVRSPRALQQELAAAAAKGAFDPWNHNRPDRWSTRRTLAFIFVTCSTFWIGLALLLTQLS